MEWLETTVIVSRDLFGVLACCTIMFLIIIVVAIIVCGIVLWQNRSIKDKPKYRISSVYLHDDIVLYELGGLERKSGMYYPLKVTLIGADAKTWAEDFKCEIIPI